MNLQRREEIRALIADQNMEDPQALADCRNALVELLAHIDALEQTAAERVIAAGMFAEIHKAVGVILSDPTMEMNETALHDALSGEFVRIKDICVKVGASPTPDYTGEGRAWAPSVEARAVVVPEIMLSDISDECGAMLCDDREAFRRGALWAQKFITSRVRAIPADRGLGEGMVAVDASIIIATIEMLDLFCREYINVEDVRRMAKERAGHLREKIGTLRANQGGAAT